MDLDYLENEYEHIMSATRVRKETDNFEESKAYNTAQNKVTEVDAGSHCFKDIYHSQIKEKNENDGDLAEGAKEQVVLDMSQYSMDDSKLGETKKLQLIIRREESKYER